MGLFGGKKIKIGVWLMLVFVLEDFVVEGYELLFKIVEWCQFFKLKLIYIDVLFGYINLEMNCVYIFYVFVVMIIGWFFLLELNLQNILVCMEVGCKICQVFVVEKGYKLIFVDYSQIELCVLVYMVDILQFKKVFEDGFDIYVMMVFEMFGVVIEGMDLMVCWQVKVINFGIIYGILVFGFVNQFGIFRGEVGDYIKIYFEWFLGIKEYMEVIKKQVYVNGYVIMIFGCKVYYLDVNIKNLNMCFFYEWVVINVLIQGLVVDILCCVMLCMEDWLVVVKFDVQMLLQVYDELIFEVLDVEVDVMIFVIKDVMENVCDLVFKLFVFLQVDVCVVDNWDEVY